MSTNSFTNAFPPMQVKSMNGNNPQQAALNNFMNGQSSTARLSELAGGKHRKRRGGQGSVVVPQAPSTYTDTAIPAINGAGGILAKLISTTNQSAANSENDKLANAVTKLGGGSRRKRGTKRRSKRRSKKIRKSRKYRK